MKKIIFYTVISIFTILFTGCTGNKDNQEISDTRNPAYVDEDAEEESVNVTVSEAEYRITDSMKDLKAAVIGILEDTYWPDTLLDSEELAERTGISENMYENYLAEYQNAQAGIDMMILIEAKPEETAIIENYLNEYRDVLLRIYAQQPQNYAKVYASRIEVIDNYVCYVQLGADLSQLAPKGHEEMVAYCQQANESALDILEKRILKD